MSKAWLVIRGRRLVSVLFGFLMIVGMPFHAFSQDRVVRETSVDTVHDFTQLSLEELMNVEVTSVSKRKQKLSGAAAAISSTKCLR
ncbi:hypothetical protein [Candidatus Nitrospira salsa]|nr:MAG: hypothetical protein NPIRA01_38010 [Nitrospirales bacterium]